jgi:OOP family OmpA-OmpF porin
MEKLMKRSNTIVRKFLLLVSLSCLVAAPVIAVQIVTEEDLVEGVIVEEQLVRLADNAIFMLDTSSSMDYKFRETGKTRLELVENQMTKAVSYFPDIGYNFGIYTFTSWEEFYAVQPFDREKITAVLQSLPKEGSGPTPLATGLRKLEDVLKPLSGRSIVFLFSDGDYTGGSPAKIARKIATDYDVCFLVISTAKESQNHTLAQDVASLNSCSRMIPFENYLNRPEYTSGALFDVRATETIVRSTETRVVGLEAEGINFGFDKTELTANDKAELDKLGEVMKEEPDSYAVIVGYTDNVGAEDYNEGLSRRRAEIVASYIMDNHGVDATRLVLQWLGSDNPLMSNDTPEGRATNRRVEMAVGGF